MIKYDGMNVRDKSIPTINKCSIHIPSCSLLQISHWLGAAVLDPICIPTGLITCSKHQYMILCILISECTFMFNMKIDAIGLRICLPHGAVLVAMNCLISHKTLTGSSVLPL